MILEETITGKKWKEVHSALEESYKDPTEYRNEYKNGREIRDLQVGNKADKITVAGPVPLNKIPIPFQRNIVQTAASFLFGAPVKMRLGADSTEDETFQKLIDLWESLRLDTKLLQACEKTKSETSSAILLRIVKDEDSNELSMKSTLLSSEDGKLMPGFDEYGDLIVFGYEFKTKDSKGDEVNNLYLYLKDTVQRLIVDGDDYKEVDNKPHFFGKIPMVYFSQEVPEWEYVKDMIDRFENSFSKFADTNDYFASPFFKSKGDIDFTPKMDDTGTVYKLNVFETDHGNLIEADIDVVSWEHAPDSVKLEFETLKGLIYDLTSTPDLSFDNVKGLGNISGVALKLMFLSPIIKSKFTEATYKTGVQRLVNVLRAGMINGLKEAQDSFKWEKISIDFQSILPENIAEIITMLSEATFDKPVMSQETALGILPLVKDVKKEKSLIKSESVSDLGDTLN